LFEVEIFSRPQKDLLIIPIPEQLKILDSIGKLKQNPFPKGIKKALQ